MENNVIYNQRFNKAANDIETLVTEFRKLVNQDSLTPEDLVRVQLLKNEFKTAVNSLLEEVEDTDKCKITILTELNRSDIEAIKSIKYIYNDLEDNRKAYLELSGVGISANIISQFFELFQELKEYSE